MKMRKLAVMAVAFVATLGVIGVVYAEQFLSPVVFKSDVDFDNNAVWKIGGVKVTATAAQLNSGLATATSSLVSNAVLKVYGSNLVIKAGGTVTVPAGSIDAAALTANVGVAQLTNALTTATYNIGTGATVRAKAIGLVTLTNLVYNGGATTGNVSVVVWTP
jgi:hypothetical protein